MPTLAGTITSNGNLLATKKVSFLIDRDVILVTGNDNYRQIKLKVTDGPVHILDMDIYFENGDKFDVSIRNRIPKEAKAV